jgi:hypothetical protein
MGLLRVELCYDDEAGNWHALGDPQDADTDAGAITLDVNVAPAA